MIPALLSLLLASAPAACDDSTREREDEGLLTVTPDAASSDSCTWESAGLENREEEKVSQRESARASFSLAQTPGSPVTSLTRHQAQGRGWNSRVEWRDESLSRKQLGWAGNGWHLSAGDMNDTALPLWPQWLPRRTLPAGWSAATEPDVVLPVTSIPQGVGAGVSREDWKAYALNAWNPLNGGGQTPWEKPWELHQFTAGASIALPWIVSLHLSETRITRGDLDSLGEQLLGLGLAFPQQHLALNGAWSSSRQNPRGGFAAGVKWMQPFNHTAKLELTLRQRSAHWNSAWDPTSDPDGEIDSSSLAGAGEGIAALKIPFQTAGGKGSTLSEAWASWNPQASTHREGARGSAGWRKRDLSFEFRALHRQWTYASGTTGFHDYLGVETGLGRFPEWRAGAYRIWETHHTRQGLSLAAQTPWLNLQFRPGLQVESKDGELSATALFRAHWKIDRKWRLEFDGSMPVSELDQTRWRTTLRYLD